MIFPWLKGFLRAEAIPLTWTLIFLNFFIFLLSYDPSQHHSAEFFSDQKKFELTAKLYYQFQGGEDLPKKSQLFSFGMRALHDVKFISEADQREFKGDQVAIQRWKEDLVRFRNQLDLRPSQVFGLNWNRKAPLTWITYQFMHAGWLHLFGNMVMLLIFAGAVEMQIGGFSLILIYLLSGLAGVLGFTSLGEPTLAPMIGASGSLSGIMAFYAVYERKKRVRFFYFLSPVRGFFGHLWLPTWMIFPLFFVTDIASYFGTASELGSGVAYTAHIGGMIFGLMSGLLWKKWISPLSPSVQQ